MVAIPSSVKKPEPTAGEAQRSTLPAVISEDMLERGVVTMLANRHERTANQLRLALKAMGFEVQG